MNEQPERQFDFWLGEWDLTWGEDSKGTNHVLRIMDEKIIQENFSSPDLQGMSVSFYDRSREVWCQTWVNNSGTYLDFTGKFEDGKMILSRDAIVKGIPCQQRMVWYNIEADQFDWNWERSDDRGKTWKTQWQVKYSRKK